MKNNTLNLQNFKKIKLYQIASAFLLVLAGIHVMATEREHPPTRIVLTGTLPALNIQVCHSSICKTIALPDEMLSEIKDGDVQISAVDLTQDGLQEIVLTNSEEGNVNVCSKAYQYDIEHETFRHMENIKNQLCNYSIDNGHVVSSYRSGAKWHEDIYKVKNNNLVIKLSDSCVGCGYITRTLYQDEGKSDKVIVSDNIDYSLRTPISTKIISQKAILHSEPDDNHITKAYLINGDKVTLIDETQIDSETYWYKVRYTTRTGKPVNGWLKCTDIEFCTQ